MTESCTENIKGMQRGQATISNPTFALRTIGLLFVLALQTHSTLMLFIFPCYFLRFLLLKAGGAR